ncbi:MAG: hypothetical protein LBK53_00010 [Heliobacteriaceae bacterium]|jgi:D-lactate dehydrogenase|nr:hypothetical protein [Heliobacteriaceae bacterium]
MTLKMILFDFRKPEEDFFKKHKPENFDIAFYKKSLNAQTIREIPQEIKDNASVISVFIDSEITKEIINGFKNLRLITTRSTGVNHINLRACRKKNVAVINVENYGSTSVVQYTAGLMIALVRNIIPASQSVANPSKCAEFTGRDLTKLTIGIVGTGATGGAMAKLCTAFGMDVLAFDVIEKKELELKYTDMATLIKNSDIITLHLPYTGDNFHMFSQREFEMMKKGSYFINTSRGELIKTKDLYKALKNGHLAGAALDVLTCESYSFKCNKLAENAQTSSSSCIEEAEIVKKMIKLPNVVITPHIAYETQDSIDYILEQTIAGIKDFIAGGNEHRVV